MDFRKAIIVITVITAAIMELIDTSIINVALAQISGNLGATIEDTSWVITAYAIANVIIIPMTGFLARYFGRKNYYLVSIIIFTFASWLCGNAPDLTTLVIARFIQGIGGGALLSTSQAILFDTFDPPKRPMASALFGMGIVVGPTIGPILGGHIIDNYSWPLIFTINIPIGIVAAFLTYTFVEKKPEELSIDRKSIKIDYPGILMLATGIGALQYVLEKGTSEDWFDSSLIIVLTVVAFIGLVGFVLWEFHTKTPVIDLSILKERNLAASNILTFVVGFGMFGSIFIFPVLVQRVLGFTPTDAGMGLVPGALVAIFIMPIIGRSIQGGVPPLIFVVLGFIFFILHGYTASLATPEVGNSFFTLPQIFRGMGTAMLTVPLINQAVVGLTPKEIPYAMSMTNMIRQLGGAFGIAIMNTYVNTRYWVHRTDLVSNLDSVDPEFAQRLTQSTQGAIANGINPLVANEVALRAIDGAVTKQSYMQSYLDGFLLISIFFIVASPFILMLKTKKTDAATMKAVSESAH
ncbi:MAG: DHA2 family efflux MFS transporter permease subunit [Cyclobacteriaceae bacterium]|nr:DHA2 family efflux MFS transporter permease subunit [Cyclobacteriaceae bacterium]